MSPRLGLQPEGAFENHLRFGFMNVFAETVPDAETKLQRDVLPHYVALAKHLEQMNGNEFWRSLEGLRSVTGRRAMIEASARGDQRDRMLTMIDLQEALLGALMEWAERYNLHLNSWPLEHVLHALDYAHRLESGVRIGMVGPSYGFWRPHVDPPALPEHVSFETREQYTARANDRINAYMDEVEARYRAGGWSEDPELRHAVEHMQWLVRHQCLDVPYDKCSDGAEPKDASNVRKAVQKLRRLLPITLRVAPGRKGRR